MKKLKENLGQILFVIIASGVLVYIVSQYESTAPLELLFIVIFFALEVVASCLFKK